VLVPSPVSFSVPFCIFIPPRGRSGRARRAVSFSPPPSPDRSAFLGSPFPPSAVGALHNFAAVLGGRSAGGFAKLRESPTRIFSSFCSVLLFARVSAGHRHSPSALCFFLASTRGLLRIRLPSCLQRHSFFPFLDAVEIYALRRLILERGFTYLAGMNICLH